MTDKKITDEILNDMRQTIVSAVRSENGALIDAEGNEISRSYFSKKYQISKTLFSTDPRAHKILVDYSLLKQETHKNPPELFGRLDAIVTTQPRWSLVELERRLGAKLSPSTLNRRGLKLTDTSQVQNPEAGWMYLSGPLTDCFVKSEVEKTDQKRLKPKRIGDGSGYAGGFFGELSSERRQKFCGKNDDGNYYVPILLANGKRAIFDETRAPAQEKRATQEEIGELLKSTASAGMREADESEESIAGNPTTRLLLNAINRYFRSAEIPFRDLTPQNCTHKVQLELGVPVLRFYGRGEFQGSEIRDPSKVATPWDINARLEYNDTGLLTLKAHELKKYSIANGDFGKLPTQQIDSWNSHADDYDEALMDLCSSPASTLTEGAYPLMPFAPLPPESNFQNSLGSTMFPSLEHSTAMVTYGQNTPIGVAPPLNPAPAHDEEMEEMYGSTSLQSSASHQLPQEVYEHEDGLGSHPGPNEVYGNDGLYYNLATPQTRPATPLNVLGRYAPGAVPSSPGSASETPETAMNRRAR